MHRQVYIHHGLWCMPIVVRSTQNTADASSYTHRYWSRLARETGLAISFKSETLRMLLAHVVALGGI
jgi:hypothetical protein